MDHISRGKIMKLAGVVAAGLMITACLGAAYGDESDVDFQVRVTGTDGVKFTGFYELTLVNTVKTRKDIKGTVPAIYAFKGDLIRFSVAKETAGTMKLEIVRNGEVYDDEISTAPGYAQLTVSHEF
jgi:hypothetical protein